MTPLYEPHTPCREPEVPKCSGSTPANEHTNEHILSGQYVAVLRSRKGKIKGLYLQQEQQVHAIKLPKYLRPMLVRELALGDWLNVWVYPDKNIWKAINIAVGAPRAVTHLLGGTKTSPAGEPPAIRPKTPYLPPPYPQLEQSPPSLRSQPCLRIQVCRKGSCYQQGSEHIWQALQTEIARHPNYQDVVLEKTGCLKACKKGPNIRILPPGNVLSRVSPEGLRTIFSQWS